MTTRTEISERVRLTNNEVCRQFGMEEVYDQELSSRMIVVENNELIHVHGILSAARVAVLSAIAEVETGEHGTRLDLLVPKGMQPLRRVIPSIARFPKQYSPIFGSLGKQIALIEKSGLGTFDSHSVLSEVAFNPRRPEEVVVVPPYRMTSAIQPTDMFLKIEEELLQTQYLTHDGANILKSALVEQYKAHAL
ncbi:MAG: hypothetical protein QG629_593 [Patescibacteria group bacterium]|nr:hypothetical protein [Candidatus Saccharibacteria bacterium]MDQ5963511.1 hypothetical protein [Patescibacteria group bacterium]